MAQRAITSPDLPLVTIVMPIVGEVSMNLRAIRGALGQSYKNVEVLGIAQRPPGAGEKRFLDLTKSDRRFRIVVSPFASDLCGAWEAGGRQAKGAWLAFLNPRGKLSEDGVAIRLRHAVVLGAECILGRGVVLEPDGAETPLQQANIAGSAYRMFLRHRQVPMIEAFLVSADLRDRTGGFDLTLPGAREWDMAIRWAEKSAIASVHRPCFLLDRSALRPTETTREAMLTGYEQVLEKHRDRIAGELGSDALRAHYRSLRNAYEEIESHEAAARCRSAMDRIAESPMTPRLLPVPSDGARPATLWVDRTILDVNAIAPPKLSARPTSFAARSEGLFRTTPMPLASIWRLAAAVDGDKAGTWQNWVVERGNTAVSANTSVRENDAWALDDETIAYLRRRLRESAPDLVIEFGSGRSTVFLARTLAELKPDGTPPQVVSIEQSLPFMERTRADLAAAGLAERVRLLHAPVRPQFHDGVHSVCYDLPREDLVAALDGRRANFVLIDGPSSAIGHRFGTLPAIRDFVQHGAAIILDDGLRRPELLAALLWRQLGIARIDGALWLGKGLLVGHALRNSQAVPSPVPVVGGDAESYLSEIANIEEVDP